jgi:quercetin dioxygenase-like cupin family protein
MRVISWNEVNEEKLNESITRKMIWGDRVMVTRWELAPNTSLPTHDHVSEQVTMVISGSVTLLFPGEEDRTLAAGDMLIIPSSKPHGVKVGPEGCIVSDIFSPIREDFIQGTASYIKSGSERDNAGEGADRTKAYSELHGFLLAAGVKIGLDDLKEIPLELVARYVYERECISLGQLRKIIGLDKNQAKDLLRQWKHGDDHSESSYRRKLERMIVLPATPGSS